MVNAVNVAAQNVAVNSPVLFGATRIKTGCTVRHESGSGRFVLTRPGVYRVTFSGAISSSTAGIAVLNIAQDGEAVPAAQIQNTVAVSPAIITADVSTLVRVYDCGSTISITNQSTIPLTITNANITIDRLC
jgi:hypothetical protein